MTRAREAAGPNRAPWEAKPAPPGPERTTWAPTARLLRCGRAHPQLALALLALVCLLASWIMLQGAPHPLAGPNGPHVPLLLTLAGAHRLGGYYPVAEMVQGLRRREFDIEFLMRLAHRANRILSQNLLISIATMVFLVTWIYVGWFAHVPVTLPMPLAVVGHEGSTLLVVFNSLRLLTMSTKR